MIVVGFSLVDFMPALGQVHDIEHHLIKQEDRRRTAWSSASAAVSVTRCYTLVEDLEQTLKHYMWLYNQYIPQKVLCHQSLIAAMKEWQAKRPELFTKRVVNHTGSGTYNPVIGKL